MQEQRIIVYGFVQNDENKVLLIQRAQHDSLPGIWELPGGGLDFGEDPKVGTKREILEECGIDVEVLHPFAIHSYFSKKENGEKHAIRIAFLCKMEHKQQITLSKDHTDFMWVDIHALPPISLSDFFKKTIEQFLR